MSKENNDELVPQEKKWHVFYVRSRHEKRVYDDLVELNYVTYLPVKKILKQWSQRKKVIEEPLFKSYIFVYITPNLIPLILEHYSVVTYISFGGKPATVRNQHIKLIKKLIRTNADFDVTSENYKIGDKLKIQHGPFKGFEGIIGEIRGKKKYVVNLEEIEYALVVDYTTPPSK